jgi:hypothetical protein
MSTNTLSLLGASPTITNNDIDQYYNAIENDVVPRNSGAPTDNGGRLGTPTYQWDKLYVKNGVYVNGSPLSNSTSNSIFIDANNYIKSCQIMTDGGAPNFLIPNGANNTATIDATPTPLEVVINGSSVIIASDISITGLTSAPAANNTCLVNDVYILADENTKYFRRFVIDTIGTEISNRNGKIQGFLQNGEYFLAHIDTTNSALNILRRGAFRNSASAPFARATWTDNATVTIMSTAWVYVDNTGTSAAISYTSPIYSGTAPASPATNDYWYDTSVSKWKVWGGSAWSIANRTLVGVLLINSAGVCVASWSMDPMKSALALNTIQLRKFDNTKIISEKSINDAVVYGSYIKSFTNLAWDITLNLDTSLSEAANTSYYFYITPAGVPIISDEHPEYREEFGDWYHPYKTYLYCGSSQNNNSSNLSLPMNCPSLNSPQTKLSEFFPDNTAPRVSFNNLPIAQGYKKYLIVLSGLTWSGVQRIYYSINKGQAFTLWSTPAANYPNGDIEFFNFNTDGSGAAAPQEKTFMLFGVATGAVVVSSLAGTLNALNAPINALQLDTSTGFNIPYGGSVTLYGVK